MRFKFGIALYVALTLNAASACNFETGEREQLVKISIDGQPIAGFLTLEKLNKKSIDLENGGSISVSVSPATAEKYEEVLAKKSTWKYTTELVDLSFTGVTGAGNKIDIGSYAGSNSLQTFKSVGDSKQDVEVLLLKQVCVGSSLAKNS